MKKNKNSTLEKQGRQMTGKAVKLSRGQAAEFIMQGINLGIILFTAALIGLKAGGYGESLIGFVDRIFVILPVYMAVGIAIQFFRFLPEFDFVPLRGNTLITIFWMVFTVFLFINNLLSEAASLIVVTDGIVLFLLWLIQYSYLTFVARELNQGRRRRRTLVVDLEGCPKTREEFFSVLEAYCRKNHIELEYVERDKPAIVLMDGVRCRVSISYYYTPGGAVYTMDISEI